MDLGRNMEAIAVLEHALSIAERNKERLPGMKKQIKFILNNAGIAYTSLGNYDRALEYHLKSLLIREGEGDKKSIASALNNLGSVYYDLRDSRHSIEFLQRAVNIKKEISDFDDLDRILINIGICYNQLGEFERGIGYLNEGLNVFGINCSDNIKMEGLLGLGVAYLGENILDKAEDCLTKSLSISKAQNNTLYQVYNLDQLSLVESKKGNMSIAIRLLEEAEVIAKAFSYVRPLIQIYNHFSIYYSQKYDFEKTAFYLAKYRQLQDSIYSIDMIKKLSKVETDFTARDNIKALNSKNETLGAKLELIKGQRSQFIFVAAIIILSLTLSILFLRARKKQAQAIDVIASKSNKQNR
jgi:tetratricopeptide (TPR) repeat protein